MLDKFIKYTCLRQNISHNLPCNKMYIIAFFVYTHFSMPINFGQNDLRVLIFRIDPYCFLCAINSPRFINKFVYSRALGLLLSKISINWTEFLFRIMFSLLPLNKMITTIINHL